MFFSYSAGAGRGIGWWLLGAKARSLSVSRYVVSKRRYIRSCGRYN
ncbi:hypothetical protein [Bacillus cereus]|nr:hypothetical protein [Bacillus cereus]